jgi:hypothetical protein
MLQEYLQIALRQIDEVKARSGELEAKMLLAGVGKRETVSTKQTLQCTVVSDSVLEQYMQV